MICVPLANRSACASEGRLASLEETSSASQYLRCLIACIPSPLQKLREFLEIPKFENMNRFVLMGLSNHVV
jgi:uracil DNA glycosylase